MRKFEAFHGLYHVAGGSGRKFGDGPLHQMTDQGWKATLDWNLSSLVYSNRAAIQQFLIRLRLKRLFRVLLSLLIIPGPPNRLRVRYLQQISDANLNQGIHIEPGVWLAVPVTTDPAVPATVARLASIPHGTTIVAQGFATTNAGSPTIPAVSITPFTIGNPINLITFPEQTLATPSNFRTSGNGLNGVTQAMLDNPNSVLTAAASGRTIATTIALNVSTDSTTPVLGGGTANTAFLQGGPDGPNADAARVQATFWLQTTNGSAEADLLQYSQLVLLNFNGLSWPHVSLATLRRQP